MNASAVKVEHATVRINGRIILDDLNMEIAPGRHHFILGANGAGKTTLVKMLMGYVWPLFGAKVEILGKRLGAYDLSELRRHIAWVSPFFQQFGNQEATGLELVVSGRDGTLDLFRPITPEEDAAARAILENLRCPHLAESPLYVMSSGEQMKILIARAFMTDPQLVILDEPSVFLDITSREYLLAAVAELARRRDITVVFITQRIEDVMPEFSDGLILSRGRIVARGSREQVITRENLRTAFDMPIDFRISRSGRYWPIID